jgi:maltose-binding protein MalE
LRKPKWVAVLAAMLAMVLVLALPALGQVTQEEEQEGESADINQDFSVTGEGDNSNQCAGIQGVSNTGNSQNVIDLIQYEGETDDFEFEEVGSTVDVSPPNTTTCDQQVNQAASAAA